MHILSIPIPRDGDGFPILADMVERDGDGVMGDSVIGVRSHLPCSLEETFLLI